MLIWQVVAWRCHEIKGLADAPAAGAREAGEKRAPGGPEGRVTPVRIDLEHRDEHEGALVHFGMRQDEASALATALQNQAENHDERVFAHVTLAEFLRWEPDDPLARSWQLIDGEPVAMAPGSDGHGAIQAELAALLRNHLLERGSSCRVGIGPGIVPKVRADRNYRVPDIGITCSPPSAGGRRRSAEAGGQLLAAHGARRVEVGGT